MYFVQPRAALRCYLVSIQVNQAGHKCAKSLLRLERTISRRNRSDFTDESHYAEPLLSIFTRRRRHRAKLPLTALLVASHAFLNCDPRSDPSFGV
jgi:hypothetical protein